MAKLAPQGAQKCLKIHISDVINRRLNTNAILVQRTRLMKGVPEALNYRVSQILNGHNWFAKYLHRIIS